MSNNKSALEESSQDAANDTGGCQYRFFSEVDRLRLQRDLFKMQTQQSFNEVLGQLEAQKAERLNTAAKSELLLDYSLKTLDQLSAKIHSTEDNIKETMSRAKVLSQRLAEKDKNAQELEHTVSNMKQLLEELKPQQQA